MGAGYFAEGLGRGFLSGNRNRENKLDREKWLYLKNQYEEDRAKALLKAEQEQNQINYYKGLLGDKFQNTNYPPGFYKGVYESQLKNSDAVQDNLNFGLLTGLPVPGGASLSDTLLGTVADIYKHKNPSLSGDFGNLKRLYPNASPDQLLAKMVDLNKAKASKNITTLKQMDNFQEKELFKLDVKDYDGVIQSGSDSKKQIMNIQALRSIPLETDGDPLVGLKNTIAKYANSVGIPVDMEKVSNIEQATALTNRLALDVLAEFKGATSEREMDFSKDTTVKITQPKQAREWLMDLNEAKAMYAVDRANFYSEYRTKNNGIKGVKEAWEKEKKNRPSLFGRTPKEGKPLTWYRWKRDVVKANVEAGHLPPSEADLMKEWEATHAVD